MTTIKFLKIAILPVLKTKGYDIKDTKAFIKCFSGDYKTFPKFKKLIKKLIKEESDFECKEINIEHNIIKLINISINEKIALKKAKKDKKAKDKKAKDKKSKEKKAKKDKKSKEKKAKKDKKSKEKKSKTKKVTKVDKEQCEKLEENIKNQTKNKKGESVVINPQSNRKIKINSKKFKDLKKECDELYTQEKASIKAEDKEKEEEEKIEEPQEGEPSIELSRKRIDAIAKMETDKIAKEYAKINLDKYEVIDVAGDGNCLFNATSGFLHHEITGDELSDEEEEEAAKKLRKRLKEWYKNNKDMMIPQIEMTLKDFITVDLLTDDDIPESVVDVDDYIKWMGKDMQWGGQTEIIGLSLIFSRSIIMFDKYNKKLEQLGYIIPNSKPIILHYRGTVSAGDHFKYYGALLPQPKLKEPFEFEQDLLRFIKDFSDLHKIKNIYEGFRMAKISSLYELAVSINKGTFAKKDFFKKKMEKEILDYYNENYEFETEEDEEGEFFDFDKLLDDDETPSPFDFDKLLEDSKSDFKDLKKDLKKGLKDSDKDTAPILKTEGDNEFKKLITQIKKYNITNEEVDTKLSELNLDNDIEYLKQIILIRLENML